jgi:pyruvate/2-oxoacid:ferredoxin oxidoreductase alpha subunit
MFKIAGELLPCVLHVSARAVATTRCRFSGSAM